MACTHKTGGPRQPRQCHGMQQWNLIEKAGMAWVLVSSQTVGWLSARHPVRLHTKEEQRGAGGQRPGNTCGRAMEWLATAQGAGLLQPSGTCNLPGSQRCRTTGRWPPWLHPTCSIGRQVETAGGPIPQGLARQRQRHPKAAGQRPVQAGALGSPCHGVAPDEMPQQPLSIPIRDLRQQTKAARHTGKMTTAAWLPRAPLRPHPFLLAADTGSRLGRRRWRR